MAQQEAQWKEAYDIIVAENNMLKSSGSEALLASQWRQRYDTLLKEKDDLGNKLKMERQQTEMVEAGKYELKYRDLKESFRLYRKKAKEIFEAQNNGNGSAQEGVSTLHHTTVHYGIYDIVYECVIIASSFGQVDWQLRCHCSL